MSLLPSSSSRVGDRDTTTARRIEATFAIETYCPKSPIFCALSMVALSGTSIAPMYWSMLAAASTDIMTHTTDQNHSRPSCGSSTNHLNVRWKARGNAIAVQTMAAAAVKYVPPLRSNTRPAKARTVVVIFNLSMATLLLDLYKDYLRWRDCQRKLTSFISYLRKKVNTRRRLVNFL